jgi:hypothetical protein
MLLAAVVPNDVDSQTPGVYLFYDNQYTDACQNCPDAPVGTVLDTIYVVLDGFSENLSSLQYSISYPPQITWLSDVQTSGNAVGSSPLGIRHVWSSSLDATGTVLVAQVVIVYMCDNCVDPDATAMTCIDPHPETGLLLAKRSPDGLRIYPRGYGLVLCPSAPCEPISRTSPPSPVEKSTWGRIKSLY